jgi:hypothetical protein
MVSRRQSGWRVYFNVPHKHTTLKAGSFGGSRYGELEAKRVAGDLGGIPLPDMAEDTEAVVAGLAASVPLAAAAGKAALQRCHKFSRGSGLPALLPVLDQQLSHYVGRLQVPSPPFSPCDTSWTQQRLHIFDVLR